MKKLLIIFAFLNILASATAQIYTRPLSEAQAFYIPSDAVNNDVVGTVLAYPEFHNVGTAPIFALRSNVDNIYAVSSTGVITIANNSSLGAGNDVITVTINKSGYASYDIDVTITCISVASNTFFIDPSSATNGTGTRANPKNAIPDLNANNGYKYWFKRGTTLTLTSQMSPMGYQTNKYFCSYGQGAKAKIVGNNIRIFAAGDGCSNIRYSELEISAKSPATDGSNWLSQPLYFGNTAGSIEVSHCTIAYGMTGFGTGASIALPGLLLAFNTVHHTRQDGCYIGKVTLYTTVIGNYVYSVNWAYLFDGPSETVSGGDCIQFGDCVAITARGNYLDHSLHGNKFCMIVKDGVGNRYTAQITDNYCLAPPNNTAIYVEGYMTGTKISRNYTEGGAQGISNGGRGGTIQIDYNVIKSPSNNGIYAGTSNIYNNTFYGCKTAIYNHAAGYPAKNNLFYFTSSSQIAYNNAGSTAYNHNLYSDQHLNMFGSGRNSVAGQSGEDNSVVGDPLFASSTNFHLNGTSPAVNRGVDVSLIVDKDRVSITGLPDIGAYETGSSTAPPPPTVPAAIPVYQNSAVANTTPALLELTYDLSLNSAIIPAISSFTAMVNSTAVAISSVGISGSRVQLTLSSAIKYGDVITVAYTRPANNPLQTTEGGVAASISGKSATNNVVAETKDATPVTITMKVSPRYIHKTMVVEMQYTGTSAEIQTLSPQTLTVTNTYGKLFISKLLVTGVTSIKLPVDLRPGIYNVNVLSNSILKVTQKIRVF